MSHSIQSATKISNSNLGTINKCRKINVDFVLDRKSHLLYFGNQKGRHWCGRIFDHLTKGKNMELTDVIRIVNQKVLDAEESYGDDDVNNSTDCLLEARDMLMEFFNIEQDVEVQESNVRCPMCGHIVIK